MHRREVSEGLQLEGSSLPPPHPKEFSLFEDYVQSVEAQALFSLGL